MVTITLADGTTATYSHNGWTSSNTEIDRVLDAMDRPDLYSPADGRRDLAAARIALAHFPGAAIVAVSPDGEPLDGAIY